MTTALQGPHPQRSADAGPGRRAGAAMATGRVLLLREVATSPVAALFVAERPTEYGACLAAVKVLKQPADPAMVVGLQERSARLATLRHRHIVAPDEVLQIDGHLGIVSPHVDGVDLLDWLEVLRETNTPMPPRVVCEVLRGIAVALEAALNRVPWGETRPLRMVHADLKPSNVMVDRDGELRVLDFGTGSSSLSGSDAAASRNARAYIAPERRLGRPPTHQGDIYALGLLGIELLQNAWLRQTPTNNPDHDLHLGQIVRHLDLSMRSAADEQTLRSLLLRMASYNPASRPTAAGAAQTLRRLADRAPGPSLESFAHEHALPWLAHAPEDPDTALMVQVTPLAVEVTAKYPTLAPDPATGPASEEKTNTMSGQLGRLLDKDPSHVFLRDTGWDDADASLTESIANETEAAIRNARSGKPRPTRRSAAADSTKTAETAKTDNMGSPLPTSIAPTEADVFASLDQPQSLHSLPRIRPPAPRRRASVEPHAVTPLPDGGIADPFDPVSLTGVPTLRPAAQPEPEPEPEDSLRYLRAALPLLAMVTGAGIAAGAVFLGILAGAFIALAL